MELRYYWEIVKKWLWLLGIGLLVGAVGGFLLTQYQVPLYAASTKVMITRPQNTANIDLYYSSYNEEQLAQTYIQILKTQPVLDQLAADLGYPVKANQISAKLISGTSVLQVTVEATHPQNAADIANGAVRVLIEQNESLQSGQFTSSEESLNAQISQIELQIQDTQLQISELEVHLDSASSVSISDELESIQAQITKLEQDIVTKNTDLVTLELKLDSLKKFNNLTNNSTGSSEEIASVSSQLLEKELEIEELRATMNFYRNQYFDLLGNDGSSTDASSNNYQLQQLKSNLTLYQQMYSSLVGNYEDVRLERLRNTTTIVQVEEAVADYKPVSPILLNNVGLGIALGLMLTGGFVFLIEYLNDTVQLPEQVEAICEFPVVGVIAEIPKEYKNKVLMHEKPRSPLVESFRILRTNIELIQNKQDKEIRTILVVSPNPGDGKSTVSTNLATAYSQQGRKTLLVDADLRKPNVHRLFHLDNRVGFSLLLQEGLTKQNILKSVQTIGRNLMVLTSGSLSEECADMLTDQAPVFVERFSTAAERVVIDCPPVLFAETFTLAKEADGVIVVIKPGETKINALKRLLDQMKWINANVVGIVFNNVSEKKHGYYYQHYYSAYGYQYSRKYYSEIGDTPTTGKTINATGPKTQNNIEP